MQAGVAANMYAPLTDNRSLTPRNNTIVDSPDFPALEREILLYWEKIDAFQTSLKMNKDKPAYTVRSASVVARACVVCCWRRRD